MNQQEARAQLRALKGLVTQHLAEATDCATVEMFQDLLVAIEFELKQSLITRRRIEELVGTFWATTSQKRIAQRRPRAG